MLREVVLDTETTGLDPDAGHRIVEIGCVELLNHISTGRNFHAYINPQRDMPVEAFNVHGLSAEFLADKPVFADVAAEFLAFLGEARLVIHNAAFDLAFLNAELRRLGRPAFGSDRTVDTLLLARRRHPAGPNRLDDLCQRYGIDNSRRTKHGALLDAELLAEVYVELIGGRQAALVLDAETVRLADTAAPAAHGPRPRPLEPRLTEAERASHRTFVASLGEGALWRRYLDG